MRKSITEVKNWMDMQKYYDMKDKGATPEDIYLQARDGNPSNKIEAIKIIRQLFDLSFVEAKTIKHNAYAKESGLNRDEYYQRRTNMIEKALEEDAKD